MKARGGISRALVAGLVVVIVILVAAVVVFVGFPGAAPGGSTTTSSVSTPANLLMATNQTPSSYCSEPTSPYSSSSLAINWGNLAPGTEGIKFVCIENTGTTAVTLAVNSSLPASTGKVTSPQEGTILYGGASKLIELDLWLTTSVQLGPMQSFTVTIGGTQ